MSKNVPSFIQQPIHKYYWLHPWAVPPNPTKAAHYKKLLWQNGYLSTNFTRREGMSKDGTPIPNRLRRAAQRHAFLLERVRRKIGNKPIHIGSWYRSPAHNAAVGGASKSQHMTGRATDHFDAFIEAVGPGIWNAACEAVFKRGGIGYAYGSRVRHVDSRSFRLFRAPRWWY